MANDDKITDVYAGRYKPMKDAPKDGTAVCLKGAGAMILGTRTGRAD